MTNYSNLIAKSNLGFVNNMTVDLSFKDNTVFIQFYKDGEKGFGVNAYLDGVNKDWSGNLIATYSYKVSNGETHYLHMRETENCTYFQTVQTGLSPGGSTFNSNEFTK